MRRRLSVVLFLLLTFAVTGEDVAAGRPKPAARARSDSAEVERTEYEGAVEHIDKKFVRYAGKHVARIRVKNLDFFGASINDTTRATKSWLGGILNHLTFRTRGSTIRQQLLFAEGDAIDPLRLTDSERILRNLAFIADSRIVVSQSRQDADSVNVLILVRESWGLMASGSMKSSNTVRAGLAEQNFLGLGHKINTSMTLRRKSNAGSSVNAYYAVPNIGGSFISGKLAYATAPGQSQTDLSLSRDLVSPLLRYAGAFDLRHTSIVTNDSFPPTANNTSNLVDLWAGLPIHIGLRQKSIEPRRILLISARVRTLKFTRRPTVTATTYPGYHNTTYVLGSVALIQSRYYRTNLLYNFDRMEDIPYGFLAQATYGWADEEFARKPYASVTLAAGSRSDRLGYGVGELRIGGLLNGSKVEQGVARLRTLFFGNLRHLGKFRLRNFLRLGYITGLHRSSDPSITFAGDESIRGVVYNSEVQGSKRLQIDLESIMFTPWKFVGVTCALFSFADLDFIGSGTRNILAQDRYSGLGLGIRLRKEAFALGQLQLRFAWYPKLPVHHAVYSFTAFGETRFRGIDFPATGPDIVEY
jgi:hypothetical protein